MTRRLRAGEWVAAVGAVGLFVVLFFDWFGLDADRLRPAAPAGGAIVNELHVFGTFAGDGWSALGWFMVALLGGLMLGAAGLAYMTLKRASPAWPVGAGVLTWLLGSAIWLVLLVRVTVAQPGQDELTAVQVPGYLGLLFAALIPIGAFLSIRDERTDSAEAQAYMPPPARTAPSPRAS